MQTAARAEEESLIASFEYPSLGYEEKTWSEGKITKDKFHIQRGSSYPIDYDKAGVTPERCWALIAWLYKYGSKAEHYSGYEATFTRADSTSVRKVFDDLRNRFVFEQIVDDCYAKIDGKAHNKIGENDVLKFEYSCEAEKKCGEFTNTKFKLRKAASDGSAIEKEGATPESIWQLIKWLYKYGTEIKNDPPPKTAYVVTFYFPKEQTEKKVLMPEPVLLQILINGDD